MRKGFLHVVEIILVAAMTLLIIQLSYTPTQVPDWKTVGLYTQANDLLFSLERKGVDWFNSTAVEAAVSSFVSNNTVYTLSVRNAMKRSIYVGCICSDTEYAAINGMLKNFEINGQLTDFQVYQTVPRFSHDFDVIVINGSSMAPYYDQMRQFLEADKGVVEFRHFSQASDIDSVQTDFFGLAWNGLLVKDTQSIEFGSNLSTHPNYNIFKYFHNIPLYHNNFSSGSAAGWNRLTGSWNVISQNYYEGSTGPDPEAVSYYGTVFNDTYTVRAHLRFGTNDAAKIMLYKDPGDTDTYVAVVFDAASDRVRVYNNNSGSSSGPRGSNDTTLNTGVWYDVKIVPAGNRLRVYLNNSLVLSSNSVNTLANSQIGLGVEEPGSTARFDNVRVTFTEEHVFDDALLTSDKIQQLNGDDYKVILVQNTSNIAACVINSDMVEGSGRTAWLASADPSSQEAGNMLRTLVGWAAGMENDIVKNEIKNVPVVAGIYKAYDYDMFQPVEVVLTLGSLYG